MATHLAVGGGIINLHTLALEGVSTFLIFTTHTYTTQRHAPPTVLVWGADNDIQPARVEEALNPKP